MLQAVTLGWRRAAKGMDGLGSGYN